MILVTGGTGHLGNVLVRELEETGKSCQSPGSTWRRYNCPGRNTGRNRLWQHSRYIIP